MKFKKILDYITKSRGVGNTTLLQNGMQNYDRPFFVLGSHMNYTLTLCKESRNPNAKPLSIEDLDSKTRGVNLPIAIDNSFLYEMTLEANDGYQILKEENRLILDQNRKLESKNEILREKIVLISKELNSEKSLHIKSKTILCNYLDNLEEIKNLSLFDRIFKWKEKTQ